MSLTLNYRTFLSSNDDAQIRQALSFVYVYALVTHIVFLLAFRYYGIKQMELINYFSPFIYLSALYLNRIKLVLPGALIAFMEATVHGGVSVIFVGWEANFHLYVILVFLLLFFLYNVPILLRIILAMITTAAYVCLYLYAMSNPPLYEVPENTVKAAGIINIVNNAMVLSLFALAYAHFIRDSIRKLRESEENQRILNAQKNKFFSIFSHDLKNPISTIHGFLELLMQRFDKIDPEKQKKHLSQIQTAVGDTYTLVNNLLEWSRSQMNNLQITPQVILVEKVVHDIKSLHDTHANSKNIEIDIELEESPTVFVDDQTLHSIMRNLVSNAIKFSNSGDTITLSAKSDGTTTTIKVIDEGVGMSTERQKELFNIEKQESDAGTANERGTGIGLIVVKEFVEKNNGCLEFTSEINKGTTFTLTFPSTE